MSVTGPKAHVSGLTILWIVAHMVIYILCLKINKNLPYILRNNLPRMHKNLIVYGQL